MSQSESVVFYTKQVLGESFRPGAPILEYISKDETASVVDLVTQSIQEFETDLSAQAREKFADPKKLRSYVVGMVNNWFRKGKELNGGTKYEIKNPGSRQGSTDPQLKELKLLMKALTERNAAPDALAKVQEAIDQRISEIQPAAKKVEVNLDLIPDHLRDLV